MGGSIWASFSLVHFTGVFRFDEPQSDVLVAHRASGDEHIKVKAEVLEVKSNVIKPKLEDIELESEANIKPKAEGMQDGIKLKAEDIGVKSEDVATTSRPSSWNRTWNYSINGAATNGRVAGLMVQHWSVFSNQAKWKRAQWLDLRDGS